MPELPEVETIVRGLRPPLLGRTVQSVVLSGKKLRQPLDGAALGRLVGRTVTAVERRGKYLLIELDDLTLLGHLGMSGRLGVVPREAPIPPHTHLTLRLPN